MKPWYQSTKLWATVMGVVTAVFSQYFPEWQTTAVNVIQAIMAFVVGQGLADLGKNAKP